MLMDDNHSLQQGKMVATDTVEPDAITVARRFLAAENAHDVQAVVEMFSEHPLVKPAMYTYTSRAEVQSWQEDLAANNLVIQAGAMQAAGNQVRWDGQIAMNRFRKLGLEALEGTWEILVEGGKITAFTFTLTPASLAKLQEASSR